MSSSHPLSHLSDPPARRFEAPTDVVDSERSSKRRRTHQDADVLENLTSNNPLARESDLPDLPDLPDLLGLLAAPRRPLQDITDAANKQTRSRMRKTIRPAAKIDGARRGHKLKGNHDRKAPPSTAPFEGLRSLPDTSLPLPPRRSERNRNRAPPPSQSVPPDFDDLEGFISISQGNFLSLN